MPTAAPRYSLLERVQDFTIICKGLWFLLLFDVLALLMFLFLPQGTDVFLAVAEDLGTPGRMLPGTTFWLLGGVLFWSVASEFSSRMLVYLSDNSGKTLSMERVDARKRHERLMARIGLFFPPGIVFFALIKAWLVNRDDIAKVSGIVYGLAYLLVLMLLVAFLLYMLYCRGWIKNIATRYKAWRWLLFKGEEAAWANKLYGIFSDVRVDLPDTLTDYTGSDLPRGITLPSAMTLPTSQYFQPYANNPNHQAPINVWMYTIRAKFYHTLLKQMLVLAVIAVLVILFFTILSPGYYSNIGAMAIICLAFGCWQIVYTCLHFADKVQKRVPIRFLFLVLFIVTSFVNNDHPARVLAYNSMPAGRVTLRQHFNQWYNNLTSDTCNAAGYYRIDSCVPVIFIAAEGGALRTGAFTTMALAKLSDSFPQFSKYVYCYSSVSGGSVGVNLYNAMLMERSKGVDSPRYDKATAQFYKEDFLAGVTGKLAFGEIINYFIPWHIDALDRAVALEEGWEHGWNKIYSDSLLQQSFNNTVGGALPALFINTTEVETGNQCLWSNVNVTSLPLGKQRDLFTRYKTGLRYSTAINLSSRFPLVSPGAAFFYTGSLDSGNTTQTIRRHYVDGGYYENKGSETLLQVMRALHLEGKKIKPYVIQFNFGLEDTSVAGGLKSFNEISEVFNGIYNTRAGRGSIAEHYLQQYVEDNLGGIFIPLHLQLNTTKFPMNWVLSNTSVDRLDKTLSDLVKLKDSTQDEEDKRQLRKLFFYSQKPLYCIRKKI
ncbi:MAG TPA: hypothetical protein VHB48_03075 [Chitinophagaceae bacterium]|nr:hypothetical protein [Chitinophagaceae bacterium]